MEVTRGRLFLGLVLLGTICRGENDWLQCRSPCKCKWVSGKKTADCTKQNLTKIPTGLSSLIQNLDLTGNHVRHLRENAFCSVGLENLHKLVLRECRIETVDPGAFNRLKIIIEIDLSANNVRILNPNTFVETERLRVLLLNQNKLKVLPNGLFRDMKNLQKVGLSENRLERIEEGAFRNLSDFQSLTLESNNLSTLKLKTFEDLPKLGSLELRDNPWNCNCSLKPFRDWAITRNLYTQGTECRQPAALSGKMWDEISSDDFACRPKIFASGPPGKREIDGGDVVLSCRATGIPPPEISWIYRSRILSDQVRRPNSERGYFLSADKDWLNLTIPSVTGADKGDYVCRARNPGGEVTQNVTVLSVGETITGGESTISLPLAVGLGALAVLLLVVTVTLCVCYCRRRRGGSQDEKSIEAASLERHGLGEQEKSLITAINPVVKPPRRYEAPSVTSHGTEMTELNRTLLDNDSVFADGVGSGCGIGGVGGGGGGGGGGGVGGGGVSGGVMSRGSDDEREEGKTPELDLSVGGIGPGDIGAGDGRFGHPAGAGTLSRSTPTAYPRQYPPDLLAFSGGRGASPTSQTSTIPDGTRLPRQQEQRQTPGSPQSVSGPYGPYGSPYGSPSTHYPANFKTLPHSRSVTPYGSAGQTSAPVLPRHGYVTIPRRPRAPSWSSGPPTSPTDCLEPVYDNLGLRTTADGSSMISINKSPEPMPAMRIRPPTSLYGTMQRSTPNILTSSSPIDRAAPEGAAEWPSKITDETSESTILGSQPQQQTQQQQQQQQQTIPSTTNSLGRKVPPRPPPKPKKKSSNGPLYEDEGEDGTEV